MAQAFDKEPDIGALFSDAFLINDESAVLSVSLWERRKYTPRRQAAFRRNPAAQLLQYNPATGATLAFRSEFVRQLTPIPEGWVHDAWIALLIATQSRLQLLPEKLIRYRLHAAQQIGVKRIKPSDDQLVKQWSALDARLATLSATSALDPKIRRMVRKKLHFFETRKAFEATDSRG